MMSKTLGKHVRSFLFSVGLAAAAMGPVLAMPGDAAACGGYVSTPEDRVIDVMVWHFYGIGEGRVADAQGMWSAKAVVTTIARDAEGRVRLTREASATALARWAKQGAATYTMHDVEVTGSRAVVVAEVTGKDGNSRLDEMQLTRGDDGQWRITAATSRTLG